MQERLDGACATIEWRDKFAQVQVTHLEASYSNHNPILVITHIRPRLTIKKKTPHRFEGHSPRLCKHHTGGLGIKCTSWKPNGKVVWKNKKMQICPCRLEPTYLWTLKTTIARKTKKMLEELCLQNRVENLSSIKNLKTEITNIIHQDELFWRQRSRLLCLLAGDKNTKYFTTEIANVDEKIISLECLILKRSGALQMSKLPK